MMNMPFEFAPSPDGAGYIIPLFWQHGEQEEVLRNEIAQMRESGILNFIVESRPHPDFLGDRWWQDVDVILEEAVRRGMRVWFFDDCRFPSGYAAGKVCAANPQYRRSFLREQRIDAAGPLVGSSFLVNAWLEEGDSLVAVVAARRKDGCNDLDAQSLVELSDRISGGRLYWDVPDGLWRVFMLISSHRGGEDGLADYVNPLEPEPVQAYLQTVHNAFYRRYEALFGTTVAGFFSDEPRFGNAETYLGTLGKSDYHAPGRESGALHRMALPWSQSLPALLNAAWGGDFKTALPLLWYDAGELSARARYAYMDVVSRQFSECYTQKIGVWCRERDVKLIGHVIEDNGAHARLGYGLGHFFRAIKGQSWSGFDIVLHQVRPEFSNGTFSAMQDGMDADFFHWGLAKLASSAAHIDPSMGGVTVCEVFGAYGWQEGLKLMKWLTDHVCVRGANRLIPHAFSPKRFDPDCPPHFYAGGGNPQWRYFKLWAAYAERVCSLLSGGRHVAPVAVLYHAEAEWAGAYMPFERVVKALALAQIDCDVVPADVLSDSKAACTADGALLVNGEEHRCIVVPYAERLPGCLMARLPELAESGLQVVFVDDLPSAVADGDSRFDGAVTALKKAHRVSVCSLTELAAALGNGGICDIRAEPLQENLRYVHSVKDGRHLYFFTNESTRQMVDTVISFRHGGTPVAYDAMSNETWRLQYEQADGIVRLKLVLEPYQSLFVSFTDEGCASGSGLPFTGNKAETVMEQIVDVSWEIRTSDAESYPVFSPPLGFGGLGNVAVPGKLPDFSGTIRYESRVDLNWQKAQCSRAEMDLGDAYEIAEVWVNGHHAGARICPPYRFDITGLLSEGQNTIVIDVTNTLAKKLGDNCFDRAVPQEPSGLVGPVTLRYMGSSWKIRGAWGI